MGNPTEAARQADALAAAELKVACEDARTGFLVGTGNLADIEQVVRLENLADRAVRKLGIKPGAAPAGPTLEQHLARLARERTDDDNEDDASAESDEGGDRHDDDAGEGAEA
jgi:hypothetical protein